MKIITFISAIVYAHNDEKTVAQFLVQLDDFLNQRFETHEVILVDDGSTDDTVQAAFAVKDTVKGNVTVVSLQGKHGRQRALSAGTDLSIGDLVFELEEIQSPNQEFLAGMLETAKTQGTDLVLGNSIRLVSRRALYAMESSPGATRTQRYLNCGFDWAPAPQGSPIRKNPGLFTGVRGFQSLLLILTILFLVPGIALLLIAQTLAGLMMMGFALVLWGIGLAHKGIERQTLEFGDYKVREIIRINRY